MTDTPNVNVNLAFVSIKLPPVTDILILGKKYPQGKIGVSEAFKLIAPDEFEMFDVDDDDVVEAVLINKNILKRMEKDRVLNILRKYVFPHIAKGEAIKVDFTVTINYDKITG